MQGTLVGIATPLIPAAILPAAAILPEAAILLVVAILPVVAVTAEGKLLSDLKKNNLLLRGKVFFLFYSICF